MKSRKTPFGFTWKLILLAALLSPVVAAYAADVTLQVTEDSWVHGLKPTTVFGDQEAILVNDTDPRIGLAMFDIASIIGQTIQSATLVAAVRVRAPGDLDMAQNTEDWDETSVTFNTRPSTVSIPVAGATAGSNGPLNFDVTALVQSWADGSAANYGVSLVSQGAALVTDSKEKAGGTPMVIEVTFTSAPTRTRVNVPADFTTIQHAIDNRYVTWCPLDAPRCILTIAPGNYDGFGWMGPFDQSNIPQFTIAGAGESATVVGNIRIDVVNTAPVEIRHLTVEGDGVSEDALWVSQVYKGLFLDDITVINGEIHLQNGTDAKLSSVQTETIDVNDGFVDIRNSKVDGIDGFDCGISLYNSTAAFVSPWNCGVTIENSSSTGVGMYDAGGTISGSTVGNVYVDAYSKTTISGTTIKGRIESGEGASVTVANTLVTDGIVIEPLSEPMKCANVVNGDLDEYQSDCTLPIP